MIIQLIVRSIKKILLYKTSYFSELYTFSRSKIKGELDFSNYATKSDLKSAAGVDTSKFDKEVDLTCLKLDIEDLDIDKLKTVPVNFSKLSNEVKSNVIKKAVFDELVKKLMLFRLMTLVI